MAGPSKAKAPPRAPHRPHGVPRQPHQTTLGGPRRPLKHITQLCGSNKSGSSSYRSSCGRSDQSSGSGREFSQRLVTRRGWGGGRSFPCRPPPSPCAALPPPPPSSSPSPPRLPTHPSPCHPASELPRAPAPACLRASVPPVAGGRCGVHFHTHSRHASRCWQLVRHKIWILILICQTEISTSRLVPWSGRDRQRKLGGRPAHTQPADAAPPDVLLTKSASVTSRRHLAFHL